MDRCYYFLNFHSVKSGCSLMGLILCLFVYSPNRYNFDRSPEVDDVKGLAAAATKHLELLKQKDEAEK